MPRSARLDYSGALHHVTMRGIERRRIFADDRDRWTFLRRLDTALRRSGTLCYGWALMTNHVHLLLRTGSSPIGAALHHLGTCYAMDFNDRHDRVGHLFQNRFHSRLVEEDAYFLVAVRYVHLNPVKAGLVATLEDLDGYPWTGHRVLMGRGTAPFQETGLVLGMLHDDADTARLLLRDWMAAGLRRAAGERADPARPQSRGAEGLADPPSVWGSRAFIDAARGRASREGRWIQSNALRVGGWDMDGVVRHVCARLGVSEGELRAGRRTLPVSRARAAIAWLARERLGVRQRRIARELGVGESAMGRCLEKGRQVVLELGLDRPDEAFAPEGPSSRVPGLSTGK